MIKNKKRRKISDSQFESNDLNKLKKAVEATNEEDFDLLRSIIEEKPELINEKDEENNSLLHYAVERNNKAIVELLIEKGADVKIKSGFGSTPLHIAARNVNLELIKLLIEKGARVKEVDDFNNTVLHCAASGMISETGKEDWEVIEYLLENGVLSDATTISDLSVSDIFFSKDWSYAEIYEKVKKEVRSGEAKTKREKSDNEKKGLEAEIKEIYDCLLPEKNSDDYPLIKSSLEAIEMNQKRLSEREDELAKANLSLAKEFFFNKGIKREKIEELCQKFAKLFEITAKKNQIEFVEVEGKPQTVKFNY